MNDIISSVSTFIAHQHLSNLFIVGEITVIGFFMGRSTKYIKMPSIIGYMLLGLILGPSLLNIMNHEVQSDLTFITDIALGFVALSIGIELSFDTLKNQGFGVISIIICESFLAFIVTAIGIYLVTKDLPMSLIFASFAPASAPAGTVAVIKEYKAKGKLTKVLYAVVGFDDGLAIIIFGFTIAIVKMLLMKESNSHLEVNLLSSLLVPLKEIGLSVLVGLIAAVGLIFLARKTKNKSEMMILCVGIVLLCNGLCNTMHLSPILTNMIIGLILVNTQKIDFIRKLSESLTDIMPIFFILFFALAGANLHLSALPSLGLIGVVYILCRSLGLVGGARLGSQIGNMDTSIKKYTGLGILSQAGVAIGLALVVKQDLQGMGKVVEIVNGVQVHTGDIIGTIGITTITATCIFFETIGPILTKYALVKAGEIKE